nr:MAG TPA: hypothetical protein [Caudoviricetes sp.]
MFQPIRVLIVCTVFIINKIFKSKFINCKFHLFRSSFILQIHNTTIINICQL